MRLKIIAGNLVAVLLLGLVSYAIVGSDLRQELSGKVTAQIGNDQVLIDRSLRLTALEFKDLVKQRASDSDVVGVFAALDEEGRRTRAFDAAERSAAWFGDPARGSRGNPDIVVITDDAGKVLARNADRNRMYGSRLDTALPAVRAAVKDGGAHHDVWKKDDEGKLLELSVAAVRGDGGNIVGALVVGYDLSNGLARAEGQRLGGRDVAFLVDDKVYSSSFSESVAKQLRGYLFGAGKAATEAAMGGTVSPTFEASVDGTNLVGKVAPLPFAASAKVAYAVIADRSREASEVSGVTSTILMLTLVFGLVVLGYGFMVGNSIVKPIEQIEEGVLAAINGNTDVRLDTTNPDLGGLAYRINQLLNVFTGVSEGESEDSEGRVSNVRQQDWKDSAFTDAGQGQAAAGGGGFSTGTTSGGNEPIDDPALAQRLSAEPEDTYYKRVFQEYVAAKKALGENINIPEDRFTQRLKGNEQALVKKHGVRGVRFVVQKNGAQVNLQPVLIR
ncbi:MAG: MXAN_5187 C-terminal domain-containing protein [Myxococcales bacterium]